MAGPPFQQLVHRILLLLLLLLFVFFVFVFVFLMVTVLPLLLQTSMGHEIALEEERTRLLRVVILASIALVAFASRLFSVIRYESVIHEFDPWFNYRTTRYLVEHDLHQFWNWFDETSWYPLGRIVGGTLYPGLMITAAAIWNSLRTLGLPVDIRNICVFMAPLFSGLCAVASYLVAKELKDSRAGLLAALFIGVAPGYISRSVAGSYDYEGIAIFQMMLTFYFWLKAVKTGSAFFGGIAAITYFYMVSTWGGYVFPINLIPLHVFVLLLMGRFSNRVYVAYSTFYAIGTLYSMQIPFVGFQPTRTSEHMAALGIFGLIQIVAFVQLVRSHLASQQFRRLLLVSVGVAFVASFAALVFLTMRGYIAPWTGRFYSLWDTGYAKKHIPIIASVSEHQPTPWTSIFFDLQLLTFLFPAGIYFCFRSLKDEHVFIVLFAAAATYFAGVMIRLVLTLTPVVCVAAAIAVSNVLDVYLKTPPATERAETAPARTVHADRPSATAAEGESKRPRTASLAAQQRDPSAEKGYIRGDFSKLGTIAVFAYMLVQFVWHCTWVTGSAYSSPSIILSSYTPDGQQHIIDDFREAYFWLQENTAPDAKILSWWDYGYQIAGMANRTVIVDNNTWNNTHIATVGLALASPEPLAYDVMRKLDVDYVLVIHGSVLGYSGDDINKFLWMIRIAQGVYPHLVQESDFYSARGQYRVDDEASKAMKESLMFKLNYYRVHELYGNGEAWDRVRQSAIASKNIKLSTVDEVYTSENWIVRIYKLKKPDNLGRTLQDAAAFEENRRRKRKVMKKY
ncbi:oligosaccharyl transferase STT3 subunit [Syncephalis pseudoplumigaleata]|uniref:dolichyl-diphosphooligosaccharide--protein glycotransferase n=1 Tax=Syncephalis pseudoplumigaleata TaxID=1712513 RepID=A0A4P9Z3C3_9FUNG|nr:oligosaccharyl transferase STT3 subunit [Syncephalis pseudoplumigaleata]|eukprot:RKP26492.1 oligosaccharyl transferase STT3 subunit [Syncephalis pseudoplumigaleata]